MPSARPLLLVVDDDRTSLTQLGTIAYEEGFEVVTPAHADEAMAYVRRRPAALVVLELAAPGVRGMATVQELRRLDPDTKVALMSGHATARPADAITAGATDYLRKPLHEQRTRSLLASIRGQVEQWRSVLAIEADLAERLEFCGMVGRAPIMQDVFARIRLLAPHARVSLITGEAGTGKELAARALHQSGPKRRGPFVPVSCSAVVDRLLESELFGHVAGAFPGVTHERAGLLEATEPGAIFLDEIGALPLALQVKLLRVIESGEVRRLGSMEPRPVFVDIVAATSRDLRADVSIGRFSAALYRQLSAAEIQLPPLRERTEDIRYLTAFVIRKFGQRFAKPVAGLAPSAERLLATVIWGDNVRQLRSVIEHACIVAAGEFITRAELASVLAQQAVHGSGARSDASLVASGPRPADGPVPLAELERVHIVRTLDQAGGNKATAARLLGISRRAFYRQLERHGLHTRVASGARATPAASAFEEQLS